MIFLVLIFLNICVLNYLIFRLIKIIKEKDITIRKEEYYYNISGGEMKVRYHRKKK